MSLALVLKHRPIRMLKIWVFWLAVFWVIKTYLDNRIFLTQISGFRLLIRLLIRMTLSWGLTSPSILRQFHLLYMQIIYLRWNKPNCQVLNLVCNILCQFDCLNIYIALITKRCGLYWTLKVCFSGWVPSKRVWGTCKILFFMIYLWVSTEFFLFFI